MHAESEFLALPKPWERTCFSLGLGPGKLWKNQDRQSLFVHGYGQDRNPTPVSASATRFRYHQNSIR